MNGSTRKGLGFGLISGIITTLGLIVGLNSGAYSRNVIIGGIIVIAIADAMSDSFGIHISEEFEKKRSEKEVWQATIYTFLFKFIFAMTFIVPIIFLQLQTAVLVSIIWGLSLISLFSYFIAKMQKLKPYKMILEHLLIAIVVIAITNYIGSLIPRLLS